MRTTSNAGLRTEAAIAPSNAPAVAPPAGGVFRVSGMLMVLATSLLFSAQAAPPRVFFTDIEAGPVTGGPRNLGVPISIFGKGFGAERGVGRVTIGGVEVASYLLWGANNAQNTSLDMIVVQPG